MKLSLPPKLVEKLVWIPVILFCKIFIHSSVFDALLCRNWPFSPPSTVTVQITLLYLLSFAKRSRKYCHYVRDSEFKKLTKEVAFIYCQNSIPKNSTSKEDCKKQNNYSAPKHPTWIGTMVLGSSIGNHELYQLSPLWSAQWHIMCARKLHLQWKLWGYGDLGYRLVHVQVGIITTHMSECILVHQTHLPDIHMLKMEDHWNWLQNVVEALCPNKVMNHVLSCFISKLSNKPHMQNKHWQGTCLWMGPCKPCGICDECEQCVQCVQCSNHGWQSQPCDQCKPLWHTWENNYWM